jgi:hypothetical protein
MSDPLSRSKRHRERAAECRRLASLAASAETKAEYEELARNYEELAQAEISVGHAQPLDKAN